MLQSAQSLTATLSVTRLPAAPETYTLTYSKPDLLRIESPTRLVVSNGSKAFVLDKTANTYAESPASFAFAAEDPVVAWAAFFNPKALADAQKVTLGAKRKIKGIAVTEVNVSLPGNRSLTLYVDDKLGIARGGSIRFPSGSGTEEVLAIASTLTVGKEPLAQSEFEFAPPAGAELQEAPKVEAVSYASVQAVFDRSCIGCHGNSGGLSLESYQAVMSGARGRPVVVPGNPDASNLIQYIKGARSPRMPKGKAPLSGADIKLISDWIAGGAKNE